MSFSRTATILAIAAGALGFALSPAAVRAAGRLTVETLAPIYMNCEGITNQARSTGGPGAGWVELESFSWGAGGGAATQAHGSGGGAGKNPDLPHQIVVTKRADESTPLFFKASTEGKAARCKIDLSRASHGENQVYESLTLDDVMISKYGVLGGGGNESARETMTLNFTKVTTQAHGSGGGAGKVKTNPIPPLTH